MERQPRTEQDCYFQTLSAIEHYCQQHALDHRFVGGTLTDLIGPQTQFTIDVNHQTIHLDNPNSNTLFRSDGSVKDVDLVIFSENREAFEDAKQSFKKWRKEAQKKGMPFPHISIEAARYPDWPQRNKFLQFVTSFEVDDEKKLTLAYGDIEQEIPWETVKSWAVDLDNGISITVLNPFAHALCYMLRVSSGVKQKDKEIHRIDKGKRYNKINLIMGLARQAIKEGARNDINYRDTYKSWIAYIQKLQKNPDTATKIKAIITKWFWNSIGTQLSHGKGPLGSLVTLSNRMNG